MTIRLTLRTLLSYLDDTLEPAQAKIIGAKVAESDQARDLMERIKQVTRRRRLMTPTNSGPGGIDPNTIAEYLDNDVTPEQAAEVEQICLASDVHLAEVAACHQILTLVLGEPALVPPSAKQRMYGLTKGPEAIPTRKPSRAAAKDENDLSSEIEPDQDEALRLGVPALGGEGSRAKFYAMIGGGVLAVCVLLFAIWELTHSGPTGGPPKGTDMVAKVDDKPKDKTDATKDDGKQDPKKDKDDVKPPVLPSDKQEGGSPSISEQPKVVSVDPPTPEKIKYGPASDKQEFVGNHVRRNAKDLAVLLQAGKADKGGWTRLANGADVMSGRPLLALPGSKSVVILKTGVELTLCGNLFEVTGDLKTLESRVTIHANDQPQIKADVTLQRGWLLLRNLSDADANVRIRFDNPTLNEENHFEITLIGKDAALLIERSSVFERNEPFFEDRKDKMRKGPTANMTVFAFGKSARVGSDESTFVVDEAQVPILDWNSQRGKLDQPQGRVVLPPWFKGMPTQANEELKKIGVKILAAAREMSDAFEKRAVDVAIAEAIEGAKTAYERELVTKKQISLETITRWRYALRCLHGIDKIDKLFAIFADDTTPAFIRSECLYSLRLWITLGRDNDYSLQDVMRKNYAKQASIKMMELFHWLSEEDERKPITYQALIEDLNNDLLPIRYLAASQLYPLAPAGSNIPFDAAMSRPERMATVQAWRKLIPPGQLPPALKQK